MARKKLRARADGSACVIYARFSSDKQRDESIDDQVAVCSAWAESRGLVVVGTYADRAMSGRSDDRPQFQKMLADAELGNFATVVVYKFDRFARDRFDEAINRRALRDCGVELKSAMEDIPSGPEGVILESVIAGYSEYYSRNLAQNVMRGMEGNAKKCLCNGPVPYGYRRGADGRFEVVPEEARVVLGMYQRAAGGATRKEIVAWCAEQGARTARGKAIGYDRVRDILRNERYAGTYIWGDTRVEGGMPAIVDRELFAQVQSRRPAGHPRQNHFALSGRLVDYETGAPFRGTSGTSCNGTRYLYYSVRRGGSEARYPKERVEAAAGEVIAETFRDPSVARMIAAAAVAAMEREQASEGGQEARERLKEISASERNMLKAVEAGLIVPGMAKRAAELKEERARLEGLLKESKADVPSQAQMEQFVKTRLCERSAKEILDGAAGRCAIDGDGVLHMEIPWMRKANRVLLDSNPVKKSGEPAGRSVFAEMVFGRPLPSTGEQGVLAVGPSGIELRVYVGQPKPIGERPSLTARKAG